jgi:hypothetical protein
MKRLPINSAFTSEHQGCICQVSAEARGIEYQIYTRLGASANGQQAGGETPGRAGARDSCYVDAEIARHHGGESREICIQGRNVSRTGALLRAKDSGGALGPRQGIRYITGHPHAHPPQTGIKAASVYSGQPSKTSIARRDIVARIVEETHAQRLQSSGAPIHCSTAANAQNNLTRPVIQRGADQRACAPSGCAEGGTFLWTQQWEAGGGGHLQHDTRIIKQADGRAHGPVEGIAAFYRHDRAMQRTHQGIDSALPTIGKGDLDHHGGGHRAEHTGSHGRRRL